MKTHLKKALAAVLIVYGVTLLIWLFLLGSLDSNAFLIGLKTLSKATIPPLLLVAAFQRWCWRWKLVQMWLKIPDLQGTWKGELVSTYDATKRIPITVKISQTLTSLHVITKTETSASITSCAHLLPHIELPRYDLIFTYLNSPQGNSGLDMHWGTSIFTVEGLRPTTLEGSYFTNRKPQTQGSITLKKKVTQR